MADNEYTLGITTALPSAVNYGATVYAAATGRAHTFNPVYDGVSALKIGSFSASANNTSLSYAICAGQSFPVALTWNGVIEPQFKFNIGITNNDPDANTNNSVIFTLSSYGTALSAGHASGTMHNGSSVTSPATVLAMGAPASAITGLTVTPRSNYTTISWVNPSDILSANIRKSVTTPITTVGTGTLIYSGTGTSFNDTSAVGVSSFYYGAYAIDADGNVSSVTTASVVTGIKTQAYPPSDDPTQNKLSPLSLLGETINSYRSRLLADDII